MYDELAATLRRQCVEMSCGNCNTCVMRQAADAIEELSCENESLEKSVNEAAETQPTTNADCIRSMSDEELAEWVWGAESAGRAYGPRGKNAWLNWLREEASDG